VKEEGVPAAVGRGSSLGQLDDRCGQCLSACVAHDDVERRRRPLGEGCSCEQTQSHAERSAFHAAYRYAFLRM
jgi:hypothetical protein